MEIIKEYKKQIIYILLGFISLLFPFFNIWYFILLFIGCGLVFLRISPGSPVFNNLARESDLRSGKLNSYIQLFVTLSILLLIGKMVNFEKFPLFIIGAAFAITTFGDGIADFINIYDKLKNISLSDVKIYSARSSIIFIIAGSISAFLIAVWISSFNTPIPYSMIFFLVMLGSITGALLESLTETEDNILIPFGSAMTMWLFYNLSYYVETSYLIQVLVFALLFGYLAYRARVADISAMLSATLLGVVIIISGGFWWFFILLVFYLLGSFFTRYKYQYKLSRGVAEAKKGARGYKNVFSNSLAALALALAYSVFPSSDKLLLYAYLGSVATATGDTLASEIGGTYKGEPRMITTLKKVKPGTDGGVSVLGELAAIFGSAVIAIIAYFSIQNDFILIIAVIAGGFIGTNIDSFLGATLQQKGYLSNNGVNLFATISGATISGIFYYLFAL
jgi:uncharacterized protein (TIGR00297 family)